jgi:hypothetical protein
VSRRRAERLGWLGGAACVVLALGLLLPAAGDWLVTRDGQRVETDGPWRVEDRLIVFTQKDGTLASVRRSSIDLEASERLTREMAERARAPREATAQEEPRTATIRLTEEDLPPAGRLSGPEGESENGQGNDGDEEEQADESLQVTSWDEVEGRDGAGLAFVGEVRNITEHTALGLGVEVILYDAEGETIAAVPALLTTTALPPLESARFRASFPQVYHYTRIEFRSTGTLVDSGAGAEESPADAAPGTEPAEPPPPAR